ncbi:MAG: GIY-YIG nuclease family protein [Deltaproteobacteria bacterium]|nr:GIY-YIG nuclease family protein [Deltaproteobacteria bacterium]
MYFVYLLKSLKDDNFYIGRTNYIDKRLLEHDTGRVKSTKHRRPLELVYYEAYANLSSSKEREKKLKQFGSAYVGLLKRLGLR